jgi:hypothetical protein
MELLVVVPLLLGEKSPSPGEGDEIGCDENPENPGVAGAGDVVDVEPNKDPPVLVLPSAEVC